MAALTAKLWQKVWLWHDLKILYFFVDFLCNKAKFLKIHKSNFFSESKKYSHDFKKMLKSVSKLTSTIK